MAHRSSSPTFPLGRVDCASNINADGKHGRPEIGREEEHPSGEQTRNELSSGCSKSSLGELSQPWNYQTQKGGQNVTARSLTESDGAARMAGSGHRRLILRLLGVKFGVLLEPLSAVAAFDGRFLNLLGAEGTNLHPCSMSPSPDPSAHRCDGGDDTPKIFARQEGCSQC